MRRSPNGSPLAGDRSGRHISGGPSQGAPCLSRIEGPDHARPTAPRPTALPENGHRAATGGDAAVLARARHILAVLFGPAEARSFGVMLWDGQTDGPSLDEGARFMLVLTRPSALREMLLFPSEFRLGAAFVSGAFDVRGDLETAVPMLDVIRAAFSEPRAAMRLLWHLARSPRPHGIARAGVRRLDLKTNRTHPKHSVGRDAEAVRSHYDVGNDFYALWLDRDLVYSCAYFETGYEDIDTAQRAKLDYVCRKLRLQPGERLLDIGCGWGALVRYAAKHFGVVAVGITLSEAQAAVANARIKAAGLVDRCAVLVRDYRTLDTSTLFDKIVSVGMVEHVGQGQLPIYFQRVFDALRPGGLFLNHGIVRRPDAHPLRDGLRRAIWREGVFIDRYVFPDGELLPVAAIVARGEIAGFEVRDVESLREHYACTLRLWTRRLIESADAATQIVGESVYRVWRLYMSASAAGFASGKLGLAQVLLAKPCPDGAVGLPVTRADLYGKPVGPWVR